MSFRAVSHNPPQSFLLHILAIVLMLVPGTTTAAENNGGGGIFYPVAEATASTPNNNNNKNVMLRAAQQPRSTHSSPPSSTANAVPYTSVSVTQALDKLERKLDQRLRVAATHFANNTAQGLVQQSLPQMLLGGHWLTEKFQFLSTLAWQSGDDKGGILGELDLVVPLYGMRDAGGVDQYGFFVQPGLVSWEADNGDRRLDVNVGLVYRQRIRERIAVGAAVFYDHNIDSDLKRIGAGADVVSRYTYLSLNYYEPLDGWRTGERLGYEERALRGVDINIEQALLDTDWVVAASGGYWKGYDSDNRQGEWQLAGSVGVRYYPLDYLSVYADYAYHHEDVDTDRFAAGIEFSYPGKYRGVSENEIDLWRPVKREKRILYAEREIFPARIGFISRRVNLRIDTSQGQRSYSPGQLQFGVAVDRALAADLVLRLALLRDGEVVRTLRNEVIRRGQRQVMITYDRQRLEEIFGNLAPSGEYVLRLNGATLQSAAGDVDVRGAILPASAGGQVSIMVNPPGADTMNAVPTLTLARDPADIAGGGAIALMITSDIAIPGTITLPLMISGQVAAGDFTGGLMQSVSANFNGSTTATVTIATVKDTDAMESYTITLGSGSGYTVGSDSTATGRITMALPILTLATDPAAVVAGNEISLVITSDEAIASTLTLPLTISGQVVSGDFSNGLTQSVSADFGGTTSATVMIATEKFAGTAKTYTIALGSGTGYTAGNDNTATGTINAATPVLSLTAPMPVIAGNAISVEITSDISVAGSLTVSLSINNNDALGNVLPSPITGSDIDGSISTIRSVSVNFNGSTTATVTIGTVADADTTAENYRLVLGSGTGYTVGTSFAFIGVINPLPTLTLATDPAAVVAGNAISLTITSNIAVASVLTLPLTISDRASSGIVAGDFTDGLTQSVRADFGGGMTATVMIATVRDGDATETYTITLGGGAGYIVGSDSTADGTINAATPTLSLLTAPDAVLAGDDISLVVTSDIPVAGTLTVRVAASGRDLGGSILSNAVVSADFVGGSATNPGSSFVQSVSANFNGSTTATVAIATVKDADTVAENYLMRLNSGTGYTRRGNVVLGIINPNP